MSWFGTTEKPIPLSEELGRLTVSYKKKRAALLADLKKAATKEFTTASKAAAGNSDETEFTMPADEILVELGKHASAEIIMSGLGEISGEEKQIVINHIAGEMGTQGLETKIFVTDDCIPALTIYWNEPPAGDASAPAASEKN